MARINVILCVVILSIAFGGIQQVDGFIETALGVVSGIFGIHEYIKNRFGELDFGGGNSEEALSRWRSEVENDVSKILAIVETLGDDIAFATPMYELKNSFIKIKNNYESILKSKIDLATKGRVRSNQNTTYTLLAKAIIRQHKFESPLKNIYDIVGNVRNEYSTLKTSFLEKYQKRNDVCKTQFSSLQFLEKLLENIIEVSSDYYNTVLMAYHVMDDLAHTPHEEDTAADIAGDISQWYRNTINAIEPDLNHASREIYHCDLPEAKSGNHLGIASFKLSALSPSFRDPKRHFPVRPGHECGFFSPLYTCGDVITEYEDWYVNVAAAYAQKGMVVVGAKIALSKRSSRTIEIHIQQGKVLSNGNVVIPDKSEWIAPTEQNRKKITWLESRTFVLSRGDLSRGYVISGLGFDCIKYSTDRTKCRKFKLQILESWYDFMKGEVGPPSEPILASFSLSHLHSFLDLYERKSPFDPFSSNVDYISEVEVNITMSGISSTGPLSLISKLDNIAIPVFDNRGVVTAVPTPLSGAALYWKGHKETGGFIAIKLYTLDIVPYIMKSATGQ